MMRRGGAAAAAGAADDAGTRCIVLVFTLVAVAWLAYYRKQVLVVVLTSAMLALCMFAMYFVDKLEVGFALMIAFAIGMLCLVATFVPDDCTGALGEYTPTDESMREFFEFHVKLKSFSLIFGNKSNLVLRKTHDGRGAETIWPDCFFEKGKTWDPCDLQEIIRLEFSCRKK